MNNIKIQVNSPNVKYDANGITSDYSYHATKVTRGENGVVTAVPTVQQVQFHTDIKVPKMGMMLVGWGGNNGSTVTASILANKKKISWETRTGKQASNYFGSITQASTVNLGQDEVTGEDVFVPLNTLVPMVDPNDIVIGGWDISKANLAQATRRAQVLEPDLIRQVEEDLKHLHPLPSIYYKDFIAANQEDRADNVIEGNDKQKHLEHLRKDIRDFKKHHSLDKVIVCWTANTERFADIIEGVNDTADNLLRAIAASNEEISPSTIFAVACILENVPFINGSPQNTFVPGCIELATRHKALIAGDDFKSGQTKIKSVLVDFLVNAGIKPLSIASYNHLGNNDGKNLSAPKQFRSKEISKSNVVDDMVAANHILYKPGEHPDHLVVIKYVPTVGDSKRALDEYVSEIFMGGRNVIAIHNTCEDSLLASPLILDLCILAELMSRITYQKPGEEKQSFHSVLSLLSYLLKAPAVKPGAPVINSLSRQRSALVNCIRALVGLQPDSDMALEHRMWDTAQAKVLRQEE